jgi:Ca2+-transporting ATPase
LAYEYFGFLFLVLALMLFISYILHFGLDKVRMPHLLAPLLVGLFFQIIPFSLHLNDAVFADPLYTLSQLGIIFLLFLIGSRLDVKKLRSLFVEMGALAILNIVFSAVLGFFVLTSFGYPPLISIIVSTALATVAETTIAPILDELGIIGTKVASLIVGPGVFDDVIEVLIASLASVIVGAGADTVSPEFLALGFIIFIVFTWVFHKFIIGTIVRFDKELKESNLFLLIVSVALIFTTISQHFKLGVLLGAIVAGLVFQKLQNTGSNGTKAFTTLRTVTYGFLGPVFFFSIGLDVNLPSFANAFQLTLLLLAANFVGKFMAVLLVGKLAKINIKSTIIIGLGLSAKFSMGIIPVQIFYVANIIDQQLFSAFVAVSTITTIIVPFTLAYLVNRWRQSIL